MSVALRRIPRAEALAIAERVLDTLRPVIARGVIVGSLRRERPEVGDIELLVEPRSTPALLGDASYDTESVRRRIEMDVGHIRIGGSRLMRCVLDVDPSIQCEVFVCTPPAAWGSLLAIRTGPADLGAIAMRRLIDRGYLHRDGYVVDEATRDIVPTETEEAFFALAGLPCVLPNRRDRLASEVAGKVHA